MRNLDAEESLAFMKRMHEALRPLLLNCVIPIYGEQNHVAVQCGTGTLFRIADSSFLVTAAHVTDIMSKHSIQLFIHDSLQLAKGIPLSGRLVAERDLDVAVWKLTQDVVDQLPNRKFLTLAHADRGNTRATEGWYIIHGYPNCWTDSQFKRRTTAVKPFTYGTVLYKGRTDNFENHDDENHLVLEVAQSGNEIIQGEENVLPKSLEGISGCSLWQVYYEGLPSEAWTVDDAMVVGLQTGIYRGGTVVHGTRWYIVNQIIRQGFPELSNAMSLFSPYKKTFRFVE